MCFLGDFRLSHLTEEEQFELALAESRKLQEADIDLLDQIDHDHQTNDTVEDHCDRLNTSNGLVNGTDGDHSLNVASSHRMRVRHISSDYSSPFEYSTSSCKNDVDVASTDEPLGDAMQSPLFSYRIGNPNGDDDSVEIGRNDRHNGNLDQAVPSLLTSPVSGTFARPFGSLSVLEECDRSMATPGDSSPSNGVTVPFAGRSVR